VLNVNPQLNDAFVSEKVNAQMQQSQSFIESCVQQRLDFNELSSLLPKRGWMIAVEINGN
jgi:hypothetical protein